jgi:hypothetical protein
VLSVAYGAGLRATEVAVLTYGEAHTASIVATTNGPVNLPSLSAFQLKN